MTALVIEAKELSMMVMSLASLATAVPVAHRETDLGGVECRGVVRAVACDGDDFAFVLQQAHETGFVGRSGAGHDFQFFSALTGAVVVESGPVGAGDDAFVAVGVRPEAHLTADFLGCARSVACDNLDIDAAVDRFAYGVRDVVADGVGDAGDTHENESRGIDASVGYDIAVVVDEGVCEAEGTHRLGLI